MEPFFNREKELHIIEDAFKALIDKKRLLRTPIIEVQGVGGIGKTSLLKQVERRCSDTSLPCIWVDMNQNPAGFLGEIIAQAKKYTGREHSEQSALLATKAVLKQGPLVMLFDALDMANSEELRTLETLLRDLVDDEKLFVVLASKKAISFQQERTVARKLTSLTLQPFNREHCESYLSRLGGQFEPAVRNLIFEWTHGYPLAMNVMVEAISSGIDPRTSEGKQVLMTLFREQVIELEVLSKVAPDQRSPYFSVLQLFSVPRRFNLLIMQDLIENFPSDFKRENSLSYMNLYKEINETTDILNWSTLRAGFAIDTPIRHLFLLLLKNEQPDLYFAIHAFLARINLTMAAKVTGTDRVRYIRESLYHIGCDTTNAEQPLLLQQALSALHEQEDIFIQFSLEFSQDEELKEALGTHLAAVESALRTHLSNNTDTAAEG